MVTDIVVAAKAVGGVAWCFVSAYTILNNFFGEMQAVISRATKQALLMFV